MTHEPGSPSDRPITEPTGQLGAYLPQPVVPDRLHRRVVESLTSKGLIKPSQPYWFARAPRMVAAFAVGIVCFIAGIGTGRRQVPLAAPRSEAREFALLLYGTPNPRAAGAIRAQQRWAARLVRDGHQLSGKKLAAAATVLQQQSAPGIAPSADLVLTGFFVISAANAEEALSIARSMPHFQGGGQVVVRPIDPT